MCQPKDAVITDAEHHARLERLSKMIETSPWPAMPEPAPPVRKYSIEPYKGFYAVMKEVAGKKSLSS
jgi:hypothetical protein